MLGLAKYWEARFHSKFYPNDQTQVKCINCKKSAYFEKVS